MVLLRSIATVGGFTLISRVLGFLRDILIAAVLGAGAERLPNTLCVAMPDYPAELQVMNLALAGVMVSAGSACSSGKVKPSHVITAMGRGDLAGCAIRVSGGWATTAQDWNRFVAAWMQAHDRHAARRRAPAA